MVPPQNSGLMKIQYTEFKAGKETIKRSNDQTIKL